MKANDCIKLAALICLPLLFSCATSAGGYKAAEIVSAQVTLVAEEGKRFALQRDSLAKARLRVMQDLENSASTIEQENDMDRMAWEVVCATFRTRLYEGTLAATQKAFERLTLQEQRRTAQEKALSETRSAVRFKQNELVAAAKELALLSQKPSAEENRERLRKFTEEIVEKIKEETAEGQDKAKKGEELAEETQKKIENKNIVDKQLPSLNAASK